MLKDRIAQAKTFGKWNDRWVFHPQATMSEPEKALCHLTDLGDYDEDHLAWLYNKASLHGVDSYFTYDPANQALIEISLLAALAVPNTEVQVTQNQTRGERWRD